MREILFYETESGNRPVEDFMNGLSEKARAKVVYVLTQIQTQVIVPSRFWQKLGGTDNLWEVRVEWAGQIYRLLACQLKENRVLLLHAFEKKTQKTPSKEIEVAEQRRKQYFQRHGSL